MSEEKYFLSFIEHINQVAAVNAKKMEELIYEDPASAIVKARLFAEAILNEVFTQEEIKVPYISSLYDKISYLAKEGYITAEVQREFDTVRLTGNKAAHDGSFNDITAAFKLHKVMHNIAVWLYEVYSPEQLKIPAYEHPRPVQSTEVDIQEIVKAQFMQLMGATYKEENKKEEAIINEDLVGESVFCKDLPEGGSYLLRELKRLQDSSQEAIENANAFSQFKKYMHVERKIQTDLERILVKNKELNSSSLILLCGSVGDGKSHLLAYLNENKRELLEGYEIFNDATESFSPNKNAMETLEEILQGFSDQLIGQSNKKVILAINMGVLHNFITLEHQEFTYTALTEFVKKSGLFSTNITTCYSEDYFDLISFGDYHSYELTEKGPQSNFFLTLLNKVFSQEKNNPFYLAYQEDMKNNVRTMIHENYEFIQEANVQKQIINLIIQTVVKFKLVISARAFLNFVADIIIPDNLEVMKELPEFEVLEHAVPNLMFKRKERSPILKSLHELDPVHRRSSYIDQIIIDLSTLNQWDTILNRCVPSERAMAWFTPFIVEEKIEGSSFIEFSETVIRTAYLMDENFSRKIEDDTYHKYVKKLFDFNSGNKKEIKLFYEEIKDALFKWKGSPKKGYIYLNKSNNRYRLAQLLNLKPLTDHLKSNPKAVLESFKASILLAYHNGNRQESILLEIDYQLYCLLVKVRQGYCPNKKDEEDAIKFTEFVEKIMRFGEKKTELLIHFPNDARFYKLTRDDYDEFDAFVFEKE
ncbi:DNA phosphorothioation-dependent restriction protein DptF [Bacillus sp. BB51/4]|uniref:DNA phosphorothioation-dependent restriction protein DptF n=1 Tax=Bacillus sp. BB51/4 TaxID=2217819 RepID=UPI0011F037CD|nr:DNA phosphorothioation-dependent restriction protein DptF [Bacillus sp. BB51/4]KAA0777843.1 DNA phosphorothioation-dependent restriction protein DptF [Bacillus sp. BB51/4]